MEYSTTELANGQTTSTDKSQHLSTSLLALRVGLSPVPPKDDGSKAPLADIPSEDGGLTWAPYQKTPATEEHIRQWYRNGRTGNGLMCGYGDLECFEFDNRDTYDAFLEAADEAGLRDLVGRIRTGYEEFTPGGGVHWLYRCEKRRGNTKLAERPDTSVKNGRKVLIETRGEGGFIVTAPSNGKTHPSGGSYKLVCGGLGEMTVLWPEERDELWELARAFDEMVKEPEPDPGDPFTMRKGAEHSGYPKQGKRPGDHFAELMPWEGILEPHGWVKAFTRGETTYWRRPGKDQGVSATTGKTKGFKVFTTSTPLKTDGTHTKLGVHAALNYANNFTEAVKDLVAKGFGTWLDDDGSERQNPVPQEWFDKRKQAKQSTSQPTSGLAPPAELDIDWDAMSDEDMGILSGDAIDPKPVEWLWPSRIAKKKMNVIAGEGKLGKTQMVLATAALTTVGGELPDGSGRVAKGTVIILSAEDDPEDTLAPRLIALGADMSKIKIIKGDYITRRKGKEPEINPVDFQRLAYWRALFKRFPDLQLFIVDPVPSFLGRGVNDHKNADLRNILTPFLHVIRDFNVAMVAITHLIKGFDPKRPASHRISGSIAYANLARSIHFVAKDPDNPARRLFMMSDNTSAANDLPAVVFTLEPKEVASKGGQVFEIWVPTFDVNTVDVDVNQVVNSDVKPAGGRRGPKPNQESTEVAQWVLNYLRAAGSPVRLGDVYDAAGDEDLLGLYGLDDKGKARWLEGWKLSRAFKRVEKLQGDDAGWVIDRLEVGGVKYIQAVNVSLSRGGIDDKPATPSNGSAEGVPF
jgi:hypothetical protein